MRVVLYGATGMVGTRILQELLSRGHTVTAVVRDPSKLKAQNNLTIEKGDTAGRRRHREAGERVGRSD